jgi:hypothetical protein
MNPFYIRAVQLLLDAAPAVFETASFAMKGGTALNLFVQDMPRLSVDIDVVFVPHELARDDALRTIGESACRSVGVPGRAAQDPGRQRGQDVRAQRGRRGQIEVNFVFRGTVLAPQRRSLTPAAQQLFSANIEVPVLAAAELYGSKLVAALDRQHPRDLFDVQLMLAAGGWDEALLDCFVVYLAGHNRPTHEVLFPNEKPLEEVFENEFVGMTAVPARAERVHVPQRRRPLLRRLGAIRSCRRPPGRPRRERSGGEGQMAARWPEAATPAGLLASSGAP